jgi:hypothetical protein
MTACFRTHWPGGDKLSDVEVQNLMSAEQASGHLVTGLRRWKLRQTARSTRELIGAERWTCSFACGQVYRVSSSRSIQQHLLRCKQRPHGAPAGDGEDVKPAALSASSLPVSAAEGRAGGSEVKVDRPSASWRMPSQVDGLEDDAQFVEEKPASSELWQYENSSDDLSSPRTIQSPHPLSSRGWADTALHILLRRQQQEAEHLSARHFMEIVALREESEVATRSSASSAPEAAPFSFLPPHEARRPAG